MKENQQSDSEELDEISIESDSNNSVTITDDKRRKQSVERSKFIDLSIKLMKVKKTKSLSPLPNRRNSLYIDKSKSICESAFPQLNCFNNIRKNLSLDEDNSVNYDLKYRKPNDAESIKSMFSSNTTVSSEIVQELNSLSLRNRYDYTRAEEQCPSMILKRRVSLERLLGLIYEDRKNHTHADVDSTTDNSHFSDSSMQSNGKVTGEELWNLDNDALNDFLNAMKNDIEYANNKLVRAVKRKAYQTSKQQANNNIITAVLQALSEKRSVDARLRFSLEPPESEDGYKEWLNAMKAVTRLPDGIPAHFRRNLWLTLANHHIRLMGIDWEYIRMTSFNDKMNPDDDRLSLQIIKDLHRTGWSGLNGEFERIQLKRVLLGYARFNKSIGYCQGFNVIGALVLDITEFKEEIALKIMIFLIEQVLPRGYFDQTLRALSVDMAVLRDLLQQRLPKTKQHLDKLQKNSPSEYEPPLTNIFSMQWFLTLFATCLPKTCVYRIWDALMLDGSEMLLRTSLAIWAKLSKRILQTKTADEFYTLMEASCRSIMHMKNNEINNFIKLIYTMSEFPYPGLSELRERYTWDIQPFGASFSLIQQQVSSILHVADDEPSDYESSSCVSCGLAEKKEGRKNRPDLATLQKQYKLLKQRQKQAAVILQTVFQQCQKLSHQNDIRSESEKLESGKAFNHLVLSPVLACDMSIPPPLYIAMNGAVPLESKIIQPINKCANAIDISTLGNRKKMMKLRKLSPSMPSSPLHKTTNVSIRNDLRRNSLKNDPEDENNFDVHLEDVADEIFFERYMKDDKSQDMVNADRQKKERAQNQIIVNLNNQPLSCVPHMKKICPQSYDQSTFQGDEAINNGLMSTMEDKKISEEMILTDKNFVS